MKGNISPEAAAMLNNRREPKSLVYTSYIRAIEAEIDRLKAENERLRADSHQSLLRDAYNDVDRSHKS